MLRLWKYIRMDTWIHKMDIITSCMVNIDNIYFTKRCYKHLGSNWLCPLDTRASLGGSDGKESASNKGTLRFNPWVRNIPWRRKWRILWPEEPGRLWSMETQRVCQDWVTDTFTFFDEIGQVGDWQWNDLLILSDRSFNTNFSNVKCSGPHLAHCCHVPVGAILCVDTWVWGRGIKELLEVRVHHKEE